MSRRKQIYEGKAKILYEGPEPGTLVQYFKDDATAFNNQKKGTITGKGVLNNRISEFLMVRLGEMGIPTHFIKRLNMREQLIKACEIVPIEVIVRNIAAGSICKRLGLEEGHKLPRPIIEFCYKNDELGDPLIAEEHISVFNWASPSEMDEIVNTTFRINDIVSGIFAGIGLKLVDFKVEYGRHYQGDDVQLMLADEISPDSCRLWEFGTNRKLDKDRFRQDMGDVEEAYQEVANRLGLTPKSGTGEVTKLEIIKS
ncbi:phosphoribosylaminoimidazolesuccinocarboxamide synthase [Alphaproteobacteria bacterium]|jgi:phosphoribosylaminoimidazole-succinocarboxamide synthase|nr:phosphoribosylaminoimidazolesuccinocarboxamide synthase [Alphaproteobacteria bacterium]